MKCPRDGTKLQRVHVGKIELDKCHQCDGIWFDKGELERIRDARIENVEERLEAKYGNPEFQRGDTDGFMQCPSCVGGRLQKVYCTFGRPLEIDRCEECTGVWLDQGELSEVAGKPGQKEEEIESGRLSILLRSFGAWLNKE